MSDWEDRKQELLEEGADEDEILYNRALYEESDNRYDYVMDDVDEREMQDTMAQMQYEDDFGSDRYAILDGHLPTHFLWDTSGCGPYITEATLEDIEQTIGRLYLNRQCDPGDEEEPPDLTEEEKQWRKEQEEEEKEFREALKKTLRTQEYLDALQQLWKVKWDAHVDEIHAGWEKAKREQEEYLKKAEEDRLNGKSQFGPAIP